MYVCACLYYVFVLKLILESTAPNVPSDASAPLCSNTHCHCADIGTVSADEVRKAIHSTAVKSSPLDLLPSVLLRECADVFVPVVAHMANLSFIRGTSPRAFKTAQVLPLLKKPDLDKDELANYRPISNLSTISKILEQLALNKLRPHLLGSRHYARLQSAYRPGHSTETALLQVLDGVCRAVDARRPVLLVALDISAAFDTISHEVLLSASSVFPVLHYCSLLAAFISGRSSAVCDARSLFFQYVAVYHWRAPGLCPGPAAVHGLRRANW